MLKKLSVILLLISLLPVIGLAQERVLDKKAPILMEEPQFDGLIRNDGGVGPLAAPWVAVDTMQNSFGPAISVLNPIAFDQDADVVALFHRGRTTYATGSGELWYNLSTDAGLTWTRIAAVNGAAPQKLGRYPSMAIGNPTGGNLSATTGLFSWPELNPSAFGFLGYGADQPLGFGSPFSAIDQGPPAYSSQVPCWTSADWFFWGTDNQGDASYRIFRTQDFGTITPVDDPNLNSAAFGDGGNIGIGGVGFNNVTYVGFLGTMPDPNPGDPIVSGWYPGYSKSTDFGATWSPIKVCDFRTIPALSNYDRLYDYIKDDGFVSYAGDINVDKDGYVHLTFSVTDTTINNNSGVNALVEVFETATGWDGKVIFSGITDSTFTRFQDPSPGLGQHGPSAWLAMNKERDVLAATWTNGSPTAGDSLCDVYFSYRSLSGDWSAPINLTETDLMNENGSHMAPTLRTNGGGSYTAFVGYWYEAGNTTHIYNNVGPAVFYVAPVTFAFTDVKDPVSVYSFDLGQNYPNPFNPSTKITYSVAERGNVSLKVYDVLGNEVADLVNTTKDAGSYTVNFDASNLASGLYIYTLKAGNFTSSKKMMLLK
jgi:hypothetical protein